MSRRSANRERLLDVAERLFAARGSQAVSLREINTTAGVSQGVLHYQFGGREGLIEALLNRRLPAITESRRRYVQQLREQQVEVTSRSEEHTSELQSRGHLVCRLLLEKKKQQRKVVIT